MGISSKTRPAEGGMPGQGLHETHGIANLSVFSVYRSIRPTIGMLLGDPELALDGVLCPGPRGGRRRPRAVGIPGQNPGRRSSAMGSSILEGISAILGQIEDGRREVEDRYADPARAASTVMKDLLEEVFTAVPAEWRGRASWTTAASSSGTGTPPSTRWPGWMSPSWNPATSWAACAASSCGERPARSSVPLRARVQPGTPHRAVHGVPGGLLHVVCVSLCREERGTAS